jgi:hypothetical protein
MTSTRVICIRVNGGRRRYLGLVKLLLQGERGAILGVMPSAAA